MVQVLLRGVALGEPHDPDSEPEDDTTEANSRDLNEQEESSHDADNVPNYELEYELEPCVNHMVRATHKADDLLAANGRKSGPSREFHQRARTQCHAARGAQDASV